MATVSSVINKSRNVSDELTERVLKAMAELDYQPNLLAGSLRKKKTNSIGLIIPNNTNPLFSEIGQIIEERGFDNNYNVLFCNSEEDLEKEKKYLEILRLKRVDGLIIIPSTRESSHIDSLIKNNQHVVIMDRILPDSKADSVMLDNFKGVFDATEYLIKLNHKNIAYIDRGFELPHSEDRSLGYTKALEKYGIGENKNLIIKGGSKYEDGEKAMKKILSLSPMPTAIIAYNDIVAIGVLRAAKDIGLNIPEEISLVGFDDIVLASYAIPRLTTMHCPIKKMANTAFDLLIERIVNKSAKFEKREIMFRYSLVVRESAIKKK